MTFDSVEPFENFLREHFEGQEPYAVFRNRVRETLEGAGWVRRDADGESDFLFKGRWMMYTSPADEILEFHAIFVSGFQSLEDVETWLEGNEEVYAITGTTEFLIEDALESVRRLVACDS